jgi:hypothetical protein
MVFPAIQELTLSQKPRKEALEDSLAFVHPFDAVEVRRQ